MAVTLSERMINRIEQQRTLATLDDELDETLHASPTVAAMLLWLPDR